LAISMRKANLLEINLLNAKQSNFNKVTLNIEFCLCFVFKSENLFTNKNLKKTSKLVDPASDHILRLKIKPCMCKNN
jgi:hypothetical protein